MTTTDLIPDIHGQFEKLRAALDNLGWRKSPAGWVHPDPDRELFFLGDFIDRGPDNAGVIKIVRELIDAGKARAVMGNHELNAILFHSTHPDDGLPLRSHSEKNVRQHRAFLNEFEPGSRETRDVLCWMAGLPLFVDAGEFRAVHASWDRGAIDRLRAMTGNGVLPEELFVRAAGRDLDDEVFKLVERTTKGPDARLPDGWGISDKEGVVRRDVRLKWWEHEATTWKELAISVHDPDELPEGRADSDIEPYGADEKPIFFGHYWLEGEPQVQSDNVMCLDYSAGLDGPLVTYEFRRGDNMIYRDRIRVHGKDLSPGLGIAGVPGVVGI